MTWLRFLLVAVALAVPGVALADDPPLPRPRPPGGLQVPPAGALPSPEAPGNDGSAEAAPESVGTAIAPVVPVSPATATTASQAASALATIPEPVTLSASLTDDETPIKAGLTWRIFDANADESGQLAMVAKSEQSQPVLKLPPGKYVVHVAFGRAQASDQLEVGKEPADKAIVLDAGGLRLEAAISGDIEVPRKLLHFDVFTADNPEDDTGSGELVARDVRPGDILTLNSGTYRIVSYFGDVNAQVKADLRVEAGKLTDATLYHKAAQVSFKLVSSPGGEAIADVDWTVKSSDGNTIFSETGAVPATVLSAGDYLVLAKRGQTVYNRHFEVQAGPPQDVEVLTTVTSPGPP